MQITCFACGARGSLEAFLNDADAREAVVAALRVPPELGSLTLRYIALFRPVKRSLSWHRVVRLLNDLSEPIQLGVVQRDGRSLSAPVEHWRAAMESMLDRRGELTLPLKSHGYLFEVVAGLANKREARQEAEREQSKRTPYRPLDSDAGARQDDEIQTADGIAAGITGAWKALGKAAPGDDDPAS